jgi:hypothetical protein
MGKIPRRGVGASGGTDGQCFRLKGGLKFRQLHIREG